MKSKGLAILIIVSLLGCVQIINKVFSARSSCKLDTPINLVPNPGFEDDVDSNSIPDGWELCWSYGEWELDSTEKNSGASSLKLSGDIDNDNGIPLKVKSEYFVEVNPEFKYKLSYWAKKEGNVSGFNLAWEEYDENYVGTFHSYDVKKAYRQNELTEQWQPIDNIEFVPLDRTKYVKFYVDVDNGTVWIDDLGAVAMTRARILHTVIYDFETFTIDLQTGDEYNVQDLKVDLKLKQATSVLTQATDITLSSKNVACDFPSGGMESYGVDKYVIEARFKCTDNSTVFYDEFPVYVVEQPERTEGGVFRIKKEIIDETDNTTRVIFDPYFPVFFGKTNFNDRVLLKSKGIYDVGAGSYWSMFYPEGVDANGMRAPVYIGYKDSYKDPDNLTSTDCFVKTHGKPFLLWWDFKDEPFWKIYKDPPELILASDMVEAYYSIRTTFDGENYEAIPLYVSEEVLKPNPLSNGYPYDRTREDIIAYTNATDIVIDDEYSYSMGNPLSGVAKNMAALTRHARGVKPAMIWLSCGWTVGIYASIQQPKMTPEIFRAQTYLALIHGAKGIGYYSFYEPVTDENPGWFLPRDNQPLWTFMGDFMQELDMVKDIFLNGEDFDAVTVTTVDNTTDEYGRAAAHYSAKTYDNSGDTGTYVFIVNSIDEDIAATVEGPGAGDSVTIDVSPHGTVFLVAKDSACPDGTVCYPDNQTDSCDWTTWCAFDKDNDTIPDFVDNCLSVSNLNQDDTDEDGLGDLCDQCNDDSSCCDYTDTVRNHIDLRRAGEFWPWVWAVNDEDNEDHEICNDACYDNTITVYHNPGDPGNNYVGFCSEACNDTIDNDNDYDIDCDDSDCNSDLHCTDADGDEYPLYLDCDDDNANKHQWQYGYVDSDSDGIVSVAAVQLCSGASLPAGYSGSNTDNCPNIANGPGGGTCYNFYTGVGDPSSSCTTDAECQDYSTEWYKWCDNFQSDMDSDGIGDVCEQ